jgi:hypothetical protein
MFEDSPVLKRFRDKKEFIAALGSRLEPKTVRVRPPFAVCNNRAAPRR